MAESSVVTRWAMAPESASVVAEDITVDRFWVLGSKVVAHALEE